MRLTDLIPGWTGDDPVVTGLTADSRQVQQGFLFAALPGARADGRRFIADAIRRGAVALLVPPLTEVPADVPLISDANPRRLLAQLAARFHGRQPSYIAAVTGTNGKTSTAIFAQQIWSSLGLPAASIGTLGVLAPGRDGGGALTTPDTVTLHAELAGLATAGIGHVALEASSHGLAQYRLDGVRLNAAGFTNLTRDHLDYHATMENYLAAKIRLFAEILRPGGTAVLNADAPEFTALKTLCAQRGLKVLSYGLAGEDLRLAARLSTPAGQALLLIVGGAAHEIMLPLAGAFMAMNALCALGLVLAEDGIDAAAAVAALEHLRGAPGRLQLVAGHPSGAAVYIDYAHTPDALDSALAALRPHTAGRLFCIIGCGGDRDPGKRPLMGSIAMQRADAVIVTDDNPRSEDPAKIRAAIMAKAKGAREIGDRATAIATAISELQEGDVLAICGKGHERGQIVGETILPFDDLTAARAAIAALQERKIA